MHREGAARARWAGRQSQPRSALCLVLSGDPKQEPWLGDIDCSVITSGGRRSQGSGHGDGGGMSRRRRRKGGRREQAREAAHS